MVTVTLYPPTSRDAVEELMASILRPAQRQFDHLRRPRHQPRHRGTRPLPPPFPHPARGDRHGDPARPEQSTVSFASLGLPESLKRFAESRAAWCSSPAPRAAASPPPSPPWCTTSTAAPRSTSSRKSNRVRARGHALARHPARWAATPPTFASGLRNVCASPDIAILIAEMRASVARRAHRPPRHLHPAPFDATQTLQRILGYFPSILPRAGGHGPFPLAPRHRRPAPRPRAGDDGGRIPAVEILDATPAVTRLIPSAWRRCPTSCSFSTGMETFNNALVRLRDHLRLRHQRRRVPHGRAGQRAARPSW